MTGLDPSHSKTQALTHSVSRVLDLAPEYLLAQVRLICVWIEAGLGLKPELELDLVCSVDTLQEPSSGQGRSCP